MKSDSKDHHRRSIRLKDYDYAQPGGYFVTIVTQSRKCLFGEIVEAEMRLSDAGRIIQTAWNDLPNHYANFEVDTFVVMPNHIHGIINLVDLPVGAGFKPAPTNAGTRHSLSEMVRAFKTFSARRINNSRNTSGTSVWQRNYFEHVIRSEESLHRIRQYIIDNPAQWEFDRENPIATNPEPELTWRI
jgi:putative transposase